ncbi:MAG: ferredoxin III, nif-specific [Proteobacteria bacterium]|nr:ferredoxin III, nif-specific [Pseudomonadota bacterium]
MAQFTTRDGRPFEPEYLLAIDPKICIGCGRCFKVCSRNVMTLRGMDEDGRWVDLDEEDDGDVEKKVMMLIDEGACIGCGSCARVCPTGAQRHGRP